MSTSREYAEAGGGGSFSESIEEINPYAISSGDEAMGKQGNRSSFKKMSSFFKSDKDSKDKDKTKETSQSTKDDGGSSSWMGKMKGLFKKDAKDDVGMPQSFSGYDDPQQIDPHPGSYDMNPSSTLTKDASPSTMQSFKNMFYSSPPPPPTEKTDIDGLPILVLKPEPPKSPVRMSTIISGMLILFFIIGVILAACGSLNEACKILGPCFMVLSAFGLCGKAYFTLFFEEDPLPRLQPYWDKVWVHLGPAYDPSNPKSVPPASEDYSYTGPAADNQPEAYQMHAMSRPLTATAYPGAYPPAGYPGAYQSPYLAAMPEQPRSSNIVPQVAATPIFYDASIDTRPRAPSQQSVSTWSTERASRRQSYASSVDQMQGYTNEAADTSNGLPGADVTSPTYT